MAAANLGATRPVHVWTELAPDFFDSSPRLDTVVHGLKVIVYPAEVGKPRWEFSGHVDGIWVCAIGHAADVEQAKAEGVRAAYRLAARGWQP